MIRGTLLGCCLTWGGCALTVAGSARAEVVTQDFEGVTAGSTTPPTGWSAVTVTGQSGSYTATASGLGSNGTGGSSGLAASSSSLSSSEDGWAPSAAACSTSKGGRRSTMGWPQKSELYLLRSDGVSCTRETVQRELLPRCRCCSGMILRLFADASFPLLLLLLLKLVLLLRLLVVL